MKFTRIKGQDKPQNIIRLPRLSKIRLGVKVETQSGKSYPKETDYFVVPDVIKKVHGEKPKSLPVMFPVENDEMFLKQYYACYSGNQRIKCRGDGERAERIVENNKTEVECLSPKDCVFANETNDKGKFVNVCKARVDVMVVIPDVNMGGVFQISTGSINSDIDIRSGLEMAKALFGRVSWVPMQITREEMKIPDPDTGKMMTHWPVKLHPVATLDQVNQIRKDTDRILDVQASYSLPEPVIEGPMPDTPIEMTEDVQENEEPPSMPAPKAGQEADVGKPSLPKLGKSYKQWVSAMAEIHGIIGDKDYFLQLAKENAEKAEDVKDRKKMIIIFSRLTTIAEEKLALVSS